MQHKEGGGVKLFSLSGRFSLLLLFGASLLFAKSFSEFQKVPKSAVYKFQSPQETLFYEYLLSQWQEHSKVKEAELFKNKSLKFFKTKEQNSLEAGPRVLVDLPKKEFFPLKQNKKVKNGILFFGNSFEFSRDKSLSKLAFKPQKQAGIAHAFYTLTQSSYGATLKELQSVQKEYRLNGWAIYLLLKELSEHYFGSDEAKAKLYRWFMLNKMGYDVKIAIAAKKLYLLSYVSDTVYNKPRYKFKKKFYYLLDKENNIPKKLYTYEASYPHAKKAIAFSIKEVPIFAQKRVEVTKEFGYLGERYRVNYSVNKNYIDFLKTYPQLSLHIYFEAALDQQTYYELVENIKYYTDGKKLSWALDFLLHFVQKSFMPSKSQKSLQKSTMFADETLFSQEASFDDRAVLYGVLARRVFGVGVVGLLYGDYLTTALRIPMQGASVIVKGKRYVIADPSYKNANIGVCVAKYATISPKTFIFLK